MKLNGHIQYFTELWSLRRHWGFPEPEALTSDRIKELLSVALMTPADLKPPEMQEIAAAVVFHLLKQKCAETDPPAIDLDGR